MSSIEVELAYDPKQKKPEGGIEPPIYRLRSGLATWPYRLRKMKAQKIPGHTQGECHG